ncbi:hypothetical protein [Aquimarina sp. 2304DJ70-9]|uniref:hypothetical protein n=1 Tax=Aquimarina penaris TaxID=3231044 RepID=UPI003462D5CA
MEPSLTETLYYIFLGLLTSMGQVLIIAICIYYLFKIGAKADSILLLIGSIISLVCTLATTVGALYAKIWGTEAYLQFTYILQGFSFVGSLLFLIGFFILVRRVIKNIGLNKT